VANETKKRLLLSNWQTELGSLRENMKQHKSDIAERDEEVERLKSNLEDAEDDLEAAREAHMDEIASMEAALLDVKYWMHDALVLHLPMRDPRVILRKVEDVLR
jgi:chromosome segregation ATPase